MDPSAPNSPFVVLPSLSKLTEDNISTKNNSKQNISFLNHNSNNNSLDPRNGQLPPLSSALEFSNSIALSKSFHQFVQSHSYSISPRSSHDNLTSLTSLPPLLSPDRLGDSPSSVPGKLSPHGPSSLPPFNPASTPSSSSPYTLKRERDETISGPTPPIGIPLNSAPRGILAPTFKFYQNSNYETSIHQNSRPHEPKSKHSYDQHHGTSSLYNLQQAAVAASNTERTSSGPQSREFTCNWDRCGQTFSTRTGLATHCSYHLRPYQQASVKRQKLGLSCKWFLCNESFASLKLLAKHLSNDDHIGQTPFLPKKESDVPTPQDPMQEGEDAAVAISSMAMSNQSDGSDDGKGKKKKKYLCSIPGCGKSFTDSSNRKKHERTHDVNRERFYCTHPGCNKSYSTKTDLNIHLKVHKGEYPHKCTHPNCTKAFVRLSELYAHERTHDNILPHICSICGKSFREKSRLKKHEEMHRTTTLAILPPSPTGSPTKVPSSPNNVHPPQQQQQTQPLANNNAADSLYQFADFIHSSK